tara:strand:- start:447 stop:1199 length:753 start_codon:yes stop_codon:yes gene_type:complete
MDNFDYKKYLRSNRINQDETTVDDKLLVERKKQGYDDREDESLGMRRGAEKDKKQSMKARRDDSYGKFGKRDAEAKGKAKGPGKNKINKENVDLNMEEDDVKPFSEDKRTDAEQEGYKDGFNDAKKDVKDALSKMKVSELKAKIRENIISTLNEQEDVDVDVDEKEEVDVDVDVEDEVSVAAGGDDIEIERPAIKAKVQVGLSPEEEIVQDSLKAAMDAADALGNEKLADQIGNTITFFTREYVVGNRTD